MKPAIEKKMLIELSLKESEFRYRRLFESAQDGVLILDAETGMIVDVNPYLINMLGYSREEFIKKKLWEVGAFRDIESSKEAFEALQANEYIRYEDLPLKTKGGRLIQVEFVSNVYQAGNEKVIQCNIRDITERKLVEDSLQESEIRYRRLFESAQDGILILDAETGMIEDVNPYLVNMLGYSREEFIQKKLWEVGAFRDIESSKEAFEALQANEYIRYEDLPLKTKDGRFIEVEFVSNVYLVGGEKVIQCNIRNITDRKLAEDSLQESEAKFRMLVEHLPTVVYMNAVGNVSTSVYVSPQIEALLGYTPQEWLADPKSWLGALHPDDRSRVLESAFTADQNNEPFDMEYRMIARDGHLVWVHDQLVPVISVKGPPQFRQGIMVNITERKQAEEALARSEKEFRNLAENALVGVFRTTIKGDLLFLNDALARIFGYNLMLDMKQVGVILHYVDPLDRTKVLDILKEEGRINNHELDVLTKSGETRNILLSAIIEKDILSGMIIDITERKQAEEKLINAREFLQSVQDALSSNITILDDEGNVVHVNSAWRNFGRLNGLKHPNHCIGLNYLDICDSATGQYAEEAALVANAIREIRNRGTGEIRVEYPCYVPGQQQWYVARITNFENNGQRWIVVAHENITERKQAEERIQRQFEHLTALSAIDQIIAANFDLKLSLSEILMHVTAELEIDAADILILNPISQVLEYGAERGFRNKAIRNAQIRLGESYAGRAALGRKMIQIPNLKDEPDTLFRESFLTGDDFICYYGVPLITKGQVKGVLEIFHRSVLAPDAEWLDFLNALAGQAAIAIENVLLFESLQQSNSELAMAYDATIEGWSRALDLRDKETEGHTQRVTRMTVKLARAFGLSEEELVQVRWGALLHDIGKMGVPDGILFKSGPLTPEEWVAMKKHPVFAYEMLSPIRYLRQALDIPYYHHEKWDGSGYPHGLAGIHIPLVARIFAVVDVWDALSSDRPYRPAWRVEEVREHIRTSSGTHFDPQVVDLFLQILADV